jgi:hypothetical protein
VVGLAARQAVLSAAGQPIPTDAAHLPDSVRWRDGPDSLLVELGD